ncbi:MAG: hypothetical protein ABH877_01045 [bacterium]
MTPPTGLWIDCPPHRVATSYYWDQLAALGVSTAAIMVETSDRGWTPCYGSHQIRLCCDLAIERDIEVVLTCWPEPDPVMLAAAMDALDHWAELGPVGLEVDLEGQWLATRLRGYPTMAAAAADLVAGLHAIRERRDVRIELTTPTGHGECGPHALVSPHVDRVIPQLYSTRRDWRQRLVEWTGPMGPGRRQREGLRRVMQIPGLGKDYGPKLSIGLAGWDQKWPGHTVVEALELAWDEAVAASPAEARFWSSKWIVGAKSDARVLDWLDTLTRP